MNVFDVLISNLEKAKDAALMTNAGFGFPNDLLEIKSVHFGDDQTGRVGDQLHPTTYVKQITNLYRKSWIIPPIDEALSILKAHAETLRSSEKLMQIFKHWLSEPRPGSAPNDKLTR